MASVIRPGILLMLPPTTTCWGFWSHHLRGRVKESAALSYHRQTLWEGSATILHHGHHSEPKLTNASKGAQIWFRLPLVFSRAFLQPLNITHGARSKANSLMTLSVLGEIHGSERILEITARWRDQTATPVRKSVTV